MSSAEVRRFLLHADCTRLKPAAFRIQRSCGCLGLLRRALTRHVTFWQQLFVNAPLPLTAHVIKGLYEYGITH